VHACCSESNAASLRWFQRLREHVGCLVRLRRVEAIISERAERVGQLLRAGCGSETKGSSTAHELNWIWLCCTTVRDLLREISQGIHVLRGVLQFCCSVCSQSIRSRSWRWRAWPINASSTCSVQFSSCAAVNKSSWLLPAQWGARGVRRNIIARTKTPEHLHLTADAHDVVHSISDLYRSFANSTIHVTPRNAVPPSFSPSRPEPSTGAAASVAYKFVYVVCSPVITQKNYLKFSQIILKLTILFIATIQDQQTIYIFFE